MQIWSFADSLIIKIIFDLYQHYRKLCTSKI